LTPETYNTIDRSAFDARPATCSTSARRSGRHDPSGMGRVDADQPGAVYIVDRLTGSSALIDTHNVEPNVEIHRKNTAEFRVQDRGEAMVADSTVESHIAADVKLAVMFMDSHGALDGDFKRYYNGLAPEAAVILNDCPDKISSRGMRRVRFDDDELAACRAALRCGCSTCLASRSAVTGWRMSCSTMAF